MSLRAYLIIMSAMASLCWLTFVFIIWTINPETTNWLGFFLFYVALFSALVGSAAIIGFVIRFIGLKRELVFYSVIAAFRQSFFFAFFIIVSLLLISHSLFTWANLVFLIIGLSVLEFFLIGYGGKSA